MSTEEADTDAREPLTPGDANGSLCLNPPRLIAHCSSARSIASCSIVASSELSAF
jgi:hypothetical protein